MLAGGGGDLWWAQIPPANQMQLSCAAHPRALLLANMPGFYHIANLDSETAFQEDLLFSFLFIYFPISCLFLHLLLSFFFWTNRFTPQEYSAAAPASVWLNQ